MESCKFAWRVLSSALTQYVKLHDDACVFTARQGFLGSFKANIFSTSSVRFNSHGDRHGKRHDVSFLATDYVCCQATLCKSQLSRSSKHENPATGNRQQAFFCPVRRCCVLRAKTEQAQEQKAGSSTAPPTSPSKQPAKASASTDAKAKPRIKSGMDKTDRDVHHALYKVIGQVSATCAGYCLACAC